MALRVWLLLMLPGAAVAQQPEAGWTPGPWNAPLMRADAWGLRTNPATLGWLRGSHSALHAAVPWQDGGGQGPGLGIRTAVGTGSGWGFGLSQDWLAAGPADREFAFGGAFGLPRVTLGAASRRYFGRDGAWAGQRAWDLGWAARPLPVLGLGLVWRGANRPGLRDRGMDSRWEPALQLRTADGRLQTDHRWSVTPGALADARLEHWALWRAWRGVRLFAGVGWTPSALQASQGWSMQGGVDLAMGPSSQALGTEVTQEGVARMLLTAEFSAPMLAQDARGGQVLRVELAGVPAERPAPGLPWNRGRPVWTDVLTTLDRVAHEGRWTGVLIELRSLQAGSAQLWELRDAMRRLREAGVRVAVYLEDGGLRDLWVAAAADTVFLSPHLSMIETGIGSTWTFLGDLLTRLGIEAQFVRIGDWKSYPERFTASRPSDANRAQQDAFLDDLWGLWREGLERCMVDERLRSTWQQAPLTSERLVQGGCGRQVVWPEDLRRALSVAWGMDVRWTRTPGWEQERPERWQPRLRVGVLHIDGGIVTGATTIPLLTGGSTTGAASVVLQVERMLREGGLDAVVVRIDSPGGDAVASDQIHHALQRLEGVLPVWVSLGNVAASGGYYAAAIGRPIHATPATLTGSIGVFAGTFSLDTLLTRWGVYRERDGRGGPVDYFNGMGWTEEMQRVMEASIADTYELFLSRVANSRGMDRDAVHAVAQGRIWSGIAAQQAGLVDHLDGWTAVLDDIRSTLALPPGTPATLIHLGQPGLDGLSLAALRAGLRVEAEEPLLAWFRRQLSASDLMLLSRLELLAPGRPMMLLEWAVPY
jgi:protease-4